MLGSVSLALRLSRILAICNNGNIFAEPTATHLEWSIIPAQGEENCFYHFGATMTMIPGHARIALSCGSSTPWICGDQLWRRRLMPCIDLWLDEPERDVKKTKVRNYPRVMTLERANPSDANVKGKGRGLHTSRPSVT